MFFCIFAISFFYHKNTKSFKNLSLPLLLPPNCFFCNIYDIWSDYIVLSYSRNRNSGLPNCGNNSSQLVLNQVLRKTQHMATSCKAHSLTSSFRLFKCSQERSPHKLKFRCHLNRFYPGFRFTINDFSVTSSIVDFGTFFR